MAYQSGTVTNTSGSFSLAHQNMIEEIKNLVTSTAFMGAGQEWAVERYDTSTDNHELILRGPGLSGADEIYVGITAYHNVGADYYNLAVAGFTGYVPGNTFDTQPGASNVMGVPAHNLAIDYWLIANGQRIAVVMKVGTPVYESFYIGKFFPYATPSQYPYPLVCAGMLGSKSGTRYSDTSHSMGYKGNRSNFKMRFVDGAWKQVGVSPYNDWAGSLRSTETDTYQLHQLELMDGSNIYGALDGIFHVTGFNNVVENTITVGTDTYLVVQDVWRTGFGDYFAMRLN